MFTEKWQNVFQENETITIVLIKGLTKKTNLRFSRFFEVHEQVATDRAPKFPRI